MRKSKKVTEPKKSQKILAKIAKEGKQLEIDFSKFLTNERKEESNLIHIIEAAPFFSCKPLPGNKRDIDNYPYQTLPLHRNSEADLIKFSPTLYSLPNDKTGIGYLDFNEEVLLSIIIKLLVQNEVSDYTEKNTEKTYTLITSYRELRREFKEIGKTKDYTQVEVSLEKLLNCNISFLKDNEVSFSGSLIEWYQLKRGDKKANDKLLIKLSPILYQTIESKKYKYTQYNLKTTYKGQNQISVWIKKDILLNAKNISSKFPYKIKLKDLFTQSYLFNLNLANYRNKEQLKRALVYLTEKPIEIKKILEIAKNNKIDDFEEYIYSLNAPIYNKKSKYISIDDSYTLIFKLSRSKNIFFKEEIENYIYSIISINDQKKYAFTSWEFRKIENEDFLVAYPSNELVSEVKKANLRTKNS